MVKFIVAQKAFLVLVPDNKMGSLVKHVCIYKQNLNAPHPDCPPPLPLAHPAVKMVSTSKLVGNVDIIHTIVVIIIYFCMQESHPHIDSCILVKYSLLLFHPF